MNEKKDQQAQTAIRLPLSIIARLDRLAESMAKTTGVPITRAVVHRLAVEHGIERLEAKAKKK